MNTVHRATRVLAALLVFVACIVVASGFMLKAALAPQAGEWATPLSLGPWHIQAGVPSLLRLATAPGVGAMLDGHTLQSRAGPVHFVWLKSTRALDCTPCTLRTRALGGEPLQFDNLRLTVRRQANQLDGEVSAGNLRAAWQAVIGTRGMTAHLQLPMTEIGDVYTLFGTAIPEVVHARITGRFAMTVALELPAGTFSVVPVVEGFAVSGLGTQALAAMDSNCSSSAARIPLDGWLARAVIAAEDQRFFEHPGYDLQEIKASLRHNQQAQDDDSSGRGGSTLSQQLAKLLVTGGERSPVRKLRELLYAVEMEETLGKPRILQLYLAHAPWGGKLCGASAASRRYFGKPPQALDALEASWLAAMLHNPGMELEHWARSGEINRMRTKWVLQGIRPMPTRKGARLVEQLKSVDWHFCLDPCYDGAARGAPVS